MVIRMEYRPATNPSAILRVEDGIVRWVTKGRVVGRMTEEEIMEAYRELSRRGKVGFSELTARLGNSVKAAIFMNYLVAKGMARIERVIPDVGEIRKGEWELDFKP